MGPEMLSVRQVVARVGLHRSTIWKKVRAGTFPSPIQLSESRNGTTCRIGWPESEITAWIEACPRLTYGAETPAEAEAA